MAILIYLVLCRVFCHPRRIFSCQFADLLKVSTSDSAFRSECDVARRFILGEIDGKAISSVPELCELLLPMKTAFPSVCKFYAGALAFGAIVPRCVRLRFLS